MERQPISNSSPETQLKLYKRVRQSEQTMFPEFEKEDFGIMDMNRTDERNFYFTPSHHFKQFLIDQNVLSRLENGENLLSFGSGSAYLERLIVNEFSISPDQVVLTDRNTQDLPEEFEAHEFDMHGKWPDFGRKFTYAIFPECFTSLLEFQRSNYPEGNSQSTEAATDLIKRCFDILEDYGEVRIDGHCLRQDELELIQRKLLEEGIGITWNPVLIVARKADK